MPYQGVSGIRDPVAQWSSWLSTSFSSGILFRCPGFHDTSGSSGVFTFITASFGVLCLFLKGKALVSTYDFLLLAKFCLMPPVFQLS